MLSLGINSIKIGQLSLALLRQSLIFRFRFLVVCWSVNLHNLNLLLGVNQHFLSISPSLIDVSNSIGFNFVCHNFLLTLGLSNHDGGVLFSLYFKHVFVCIGLQNLLLWINLGSLDLGSQLEHFSFIVSLLISEFLVLLIFERKFLVFLLFLVVL